MLKPAATLTLYWRLLICQTQAPFPPSVRSVELKTGLQTTSQTSESCLPTKSVVKDRLGRSEEGHPSGSTFCKKLRTLEDSVRVGS